LATAWPRIAICQESLLLAADGGGVEEQLRALEAHDARGLRKPLVPADPRTDHGVARLPGLEAGVAGVEVELLLVARAVGDVALAVSADDRSVGVDDGERVVVGALGAFEEADRQHHLELRRQLLHAFDDGVRVGRMRQREELLLLFGRKVRRLEELLDQDDLGAAPGGLPHQRLGVGDIRLAIPAAGHLGRGHGDFSLCHVVASKQL
jgi:hypothetical protein